ncbi:TlpA family protein disulfide reductase [Yinghuangia sp. ASG 101]|uniref:TlpA family protein disulfide reductase n=1 Tax=Yinghuangia sp. ASG 101 TaxID=2896848 RepID=UPI001E5C8C6D|nr:TlpA disulfide reductase family protein [Yinghuangia sp. ASG 101]UGQ14754.1 TlpA family protein disulfide reductase [Yinghuangia sp. ASG 101]
MLTRSPMRRAAALVAVMVLALAGCSGWSGAGDSDGDDLGYVDSKSQLIKRVAVNDREGALDLSGTTLEGAKLSLADYQGKIVVLNHWASWCNPCRGEAPALQKLAVELGPQGVEFLGINTGEASADNARGFERKLGVTYPTLFDPSGGLDQPFDGPLTLVGRPATFVVDRQGRVAAYIKGAVDEELLREMINPLLGEG